MAPPKNSPPTIDPLRRYPVSIALELLGYSRKSFYEDVAAGRIKTISVGRVRTRTSKKGLVYECTGRRFVPGSEIVRLSAAPAAQ